MVDGALRLLDLWMLAVALPVAHRLRDAILGSPDNRLLSVRHYWPLLAAMLLSWIGASWIFRVYDVYRTRPLTTELSRLARSMALVALAIAAGGYLMKQHDVSRLFVSLIFVVASLFLLANRLAVRKLARSVRRRGYNVRRFAVVGTGGLAKEVVESVSQHPEWGLEFAGYVLENGSTPESMGGLVLGRLTEMSRLLDSNVLDEVIFAVSRDHLEEIEGAVQLCEEQGVEVKVCLHFFQTALGRMSMAEISGLPALAFSTAPNNEAALAAKRVFDVVLSATMLLLVAPVFVAVAAAIKLESPGPVFFRQRRVGLHGREFTFFKFRSMCLDAEAKLESLRQFNEMSGPVFKMKRDPRVTRVGSFIRRTSLDELPQFWNVLKGEMSVVGPRPPTPSEVRQYKPWQRRRLSVKPGITCTWQVSGRNDIDFDRWMQLDLAYIDEWSLWRDIQICFKTVPAVLGTRGAR
jgi:exopolysaccharide biosynthesis polyprenyl glycosylphosphotransferase